MATFSLRPVTDADAVAVAAAVDQSRDALRRWMPWYRDGYDELAARAWIRDSLAGAAAGTTQQFAIIDPAGALIGVIGLEDMSETSGRAMIGYWLATPVVGRGIGRDAVAQVLTWARDRRGLRLVWAIVADANTASRRVLEVNGFRLVRSRGRDERGDSALVYEIDLGASAG